VSGDLPIKPNAGKVDTPKAVFFKKFLLEFLTNILLQ